MSKSGERSNLVAKTLRGDDSDLIAEALVGLEVERQLGVVALNDDLGRLLNGLYSQKKESERPLVFPPHSSLLSSQLTFVLTRPILADDCWLDGCLENACWRLLQSR